MKIAIVGAGICGLYLAWKLAKKGEDVTIFEKKEKIGKGACSGLFSERILDFIPESQRLIKNKINFCLINFPRRILKIEFRKKIFVMNHFELDNLVADLASKAGVKIILNHSVKSFPDGFDKIVGCDGALSQIRKKLGLKEPPMRLGIQGFIEEKNYSDYVETWPTSSGFVWKIPRGEEIEYGIIEELGQAKRLFEEFLQRKNLSLERINSAIIPQGLAVPSNPSITLCGDATGLTKPWSGGGVIWGLMAADLLLKNSPYFLKYQKELKRFFLPKIIFSKILTKLIYFLGNNISWLLPKNVKIESDFLT